MKQLSKKVVSAALAAGMVATNLPIQAVYADNTYTADLLMQVTSNNPFPKANDEVRFALYLTGANWAQKDKGTGLATYAFKLSYNGDVLTYKESIMAPEVESTFNTHTAINNSEKSEVRWLVIDDDDMEDELTVTSDKVYLGEIVFTVKDNLPKNLDGPLDFVYPEQLDFVFGDMSKSNKDQVEGIGDAVVTPKLDNNVKFDTTAPTVTIENSDTFKFFYSPVFVTPSDTNGIQKVLFNGKELTSPYQITQSGTLVVTDKAGNTTTKEVVIDDAAYLKAKTAIEKLPSAEEISFADETLIKAARAAVDAVTDTVAKSKLDLDRLTAAENALSVVLVEKEALLKELAVKPTVSLKQEDQLAIETLQTKVDELVAKGATFTVEQLKNLTDAQNELKALKVRSEKAHADVNALPTMEETVLADAENLEKLQKEVDALTQLGDSFSQDELAKMDAVKTGLANIDKMKVQVEGDIQTVLNEEVGPQLATKVNEINANINALEVKGVKATELKGYEAFKKVADQVQGMLDRIDAVTKQIEALPNADQLMFSDEAAINEADNNLKKLQAEGLNVTAETAAKLETAQKKLQSLKEQRAGLVKQIAESKFTITLKENDIKAIQDLRSQVEALNKKAANFTESELKVLTDAENELVMLQNRSKKAHADIKTLPTAQDTVLSDKDKLDTLRNEISELKLLGDVFSEEELGRLAAVEEGLQAIQQLKQDVEQKIESILNQEICPELATEINAIQEGLDALNAKGLRNEQVAGYEEFVKAKQQVQEMLQQIQQVTQQIMALPQGDSLKFTHEADIVNAEKALKALREKNLDVTEQTAKVLDAAKNTLADLKVQRAELLNTIETTTFSITLNKKDVDLVTELRNKIDALNAKHAAFTSEELDVFVVVENKMTELQQRSAKIHADINCLPSEENVNWNDKDVLKAIRSEINALQQLGDNFTENELAKVSIVEKALQYIELEANRVQASMELLPDKADSNSREVLNVLQEKIKVLESKGFAVNKQSMGEAAYSRYEAFVKAVENWKNDSNSNSSENSNNVTNNNSTNNNSAGNNTTNQNTIQSTPTATIKPSTAVVKKPAATQKPTTEKEENEKPAETPAPTATPEVEKENSTSASESANEHEISIQVGSTKKTSVGLFGGAIAAIVAAVAGVAYFIFRKKED